MARIDVVKCHSWSDFKMKIFDELFSGEPFIRGKYIFRGHRSSDWELVSSFDRWMGDVEVSDRSEKFKVLLDYFLYYLKDFSEFKVFREDEFALLALAQHYGLATRLLDWSYSPYIASFFAFSEAISSDIKEGYSCVWALNTDSTIWKIENGAHIIKNDILIKNERLRNQDGCFTRMNAPFDSLEEYVATFKNPRDVALVKFEMPILEAPHVLADLEAMGISYEKVYPEIEGVIKAAKNNFLLKQRGG